VSASGSTRASRTSARRATDFERPERLFQLEAPGLDGDHPPPRTETAVSLLVPSNRLVGRETELAEL
jgi:hypothetical protein